jgi:anaerobic ribonucleoside-triphosphate reductase activating protein
MNYDKLDIVFQEVPNEISLVIRFTGCPLACKGCHSENVKSAKGEYLTLVDFKSILNRNKHNVSCILFMGGEWNSELVDYIDLAAESGFKTCLYTGLVDVHPKLKRNLTYLKTGPWIESRGGLDSVDTNQVFRDLTTGTILNHLFTKGKHDNTNQ